MPEKQKPGQPVISLTNLYLISERLYVKFRLFTALMLRIALNINQYMYIEMESLILNSNTTKNQLESKAETPETCRIFMLFATQS